MLVVKIDDNINAVVRTVVLINAGSVSYVRRAVFYLYRELVVFMVMLRSVCLVFSLYRELVTNI